MSRRAAVALLALLAGGCDPGAPPVAMPRPDLNGLEADVVRAVEKAQAAVQANPGRAAAWGDLGSRFMAHEFRGAAAEAFARAEELEPNEGRWPYRRAWALFETEPAQARTALERTLELLPEHAFAWELLGSTLWRLGDLDAAARHFARATELDKKNAHAWTGWGQVALERGDLAEARRHLERALDVRPRQVEAHLALAQVCLAEGKREEGERHAETARGLPVRTLRQDPLAGQNVAPAGHQARTRMGLQLVRARRFAEAIEQFEIALEGHADSAVARIGLANALIGLGRRAEGLEVLREGLRREPESEDLIHALRELGGR